MLWTANERIRELSENRAKNEERRRKILAKQKIRQVKLSIAENGLPTIEDLSKVEPEFELDNIGHYINVACDEHQRMHGTIDK